MNPRPAGYESASHSTETDESAVVYGTRDSSVAPEVALGTPDSSCKPLISSDNYSCFIEVLPTDLALVVGAWSQLPHALRHAVLAIVKTVTNPNET